MATNTSRKKIPIGVIKALYESGLSTKDVAKQLGLTPTGGGVYKRLKRAGVHLREPKYRRFPERTAVALDLYKQGWTCQRIAEHIGITKHAVLVRLTKAGCKMRTNKDYEMPSGPRHHAWRGGRRLCPQGYVHVMVGKGKRRLEHRIVMESVLGRAIAKHEHVHHINGVRDDNRPENLAITGQSKHESRTLIKAMQRRIAQLEEELRTHIALTAVSGWSSVP